MVSDVGDSLSIQRIYLNNFRSGNPSAAAAATATLQQHFAVELASCSASAKWPTVHSSHTQRVGNETQAPALTLYALLLFRCLPACRSAIAIVFHAMQQSSVCTTTATTTVTATTTSTTTTVYELALLFSHVQFHLKLSSVRLLARYANSSSSSS